MLIIHKQNNCLNEHSRQYLVVTILLVFIINERASSQGGLPAEPDYGVGLLPGDPETTDIPFLGGGDPLQQTTPSPTILPPLPTETHTVIEIRPPDDQVSVMVEVPTEQPAPTSIAEPTPEPPNTNSPVNGETSLDQPPSTTLEDTTVPSSDISHDEGTKPGECPVDRVGRRYRVDVKCSKDLDCSGDMKCCLRGGVMVCRIPDTVNPGTCPKVQLLISDQASRSTCDSDYECCSEKKKCCQTETGGYACKIVRDSLVNDIDKQQPVPVFP